MRFRLIFKFLKKFRPSAQNFLLHGLLMTKSCDKSSHLVSILSLTDGDNLAVVGLFLVWVTQYSWFYSDINDNPKWIGMWSRLPFQASALMVMVFSKKEASKTQTFSLNKHSGYSGLTKCWKSCNPTQIREFQVGFKVIIFEFRKKRSCNQPLLYKCNLICQQLDFQVYLRWQFLH